MEEVDNIIIHTCRQIGCNLDEDIASLKEFSTDLVIEATVRCLRVIDSNTSLSHQLPPGMSARFRLGTDLANACQNLGWRGEIGYQSFLYSNEADIRRILMFLIEKLPKEAAVTSDEPMDKVTVLKRKISSELAKQMGRPWVPPVCKRKGFRWDADGHWSREGNENSHSYKSQHLSVPEGLGDLSREIPKILKQYYMQHLLPVNQQLLRPINVPASLMERNALAFTEAQEWETEWSTLGLQSRLTEKEYKAKKAENLKKKLSSQIHQSMQQSESSSTMASDLLQMLSGPVDRTTSSKGSRFTHTEKFQFAKDEDKLASEMALGEGPSTASSEEEIKKKKEEEVTTLRNQLQELTNQIESLELDMKKYNASIQQMEEERKTQEENKSESQDAFKVKKRTMDLLPDAEKNIAKLQNVVDSSSQRLVSLANQWEEHRGPLIEQFRQLKVENSSHVDESQRKLEEMRALRERMKEVAEETKGKEGIYKQLASEYEKMTKDVNRSAYTRRIMEIVGNIRKQKEDIEKVLIETKGLQKEINQASGKLDRTFTVTDELIFKDAKKDESIRKAYKYLAALHENFDQLIQTVEETGSIMREIRDLEDQIEREHAKKTVASLEKISGDFKQMKQENQALLAKVKGK